MRTNCIQTPCTRLKYLKKHSMAQFDTPIVLIIYRRPDTTRRVFEAIRRVKPSRLFIVADGPSDEVDRERCEATRSIVEKIDWECDVYRNYADMNMGCRKRVSSGLDWVFSKAQRAIILEDDCVPDPSFFYFCEELLDRYEENTHIMTISGNNYQPSPRTKYSYYFSRYMHCWGWATWKRAWEKFDISMSTWPTVRDEAWLSEIFGSSSARLYWRRIFDRVHAGEIDSWAYIWQYNIWMCGGLNILPEKNIVQNIGFGEQATHTKGEAKLENAAKTIDRPLQHPPVIIRHRSADQYTQNHHYQHTIAQRVLGKLRKWTQTFT